MINRTKVKESTQIKPGDNGDVLVMKDNAPEWSTPSDADLAKASETDTKLAEKQDKLTAGDNIKIEDNVISAASKPTPINIGTVTEGETAMVSNSGTDTDVVLNFVLPKGDKGDAGSQGPQGDPGPKGDPGEPFQIRKIYSSVDEMEADYNNPGIEEGDFVLINTEDISDPDNAKIYVKGPAGWQFVTDLSGAQGIQGPQGDPGTPAGFGNITATVDNTTGAPQVSVQSDGPNTAKNISFSFTGLKGKKGDPGEAGTQINSIAPLTVTTAPSSTDGTALAIGNNASAISSNSIAIGNNSYASEVNTVSFGTKTNTRRLINVRDPRKAQDAATKNYVDTQLEPINAKLQYVPENTNQILSQIQTNVEKAQSAADAKVASITPGTGITVDASNPTAPVVSTTGLATQASVDALQATVTQLQETVTQLQSTITNLTLETERI